MDWQPISTAPKDSTIMLLFSAGVDVMTVGFFRRKYDEWNTIPGCGFIEPTHWMPLPPPPKDQP